MRTKDISLIISFKIYPMALLIVVISVLSMVSTLGQSKVDTYSIIIRIIRRVLYYLFVVLISGEWFDADNDNKLIVNVGKIGMVYLFVQYIAYYSAGIVLHSYIPFLPAYHENYALND
ncbi:MAG: hypothetical protein GX217_08895 [Clostridiaceae bacterium]|nr:hypothetical protein [Clostridiaceae bacterium]